jgi:predicted DsbA family dithiol-disulfide isomerase
MIMERIPERSELRVSVFSDYICPFCYIGSRRLLRLNDAYDLRVNWCGLEIHPDTPAGGMPIERLGYGAEQWREMMDALAVMAAEEGLELVQRSYTTNSRKALLLAEAAKEEGRERYYALHERLFDAFFREGRNIGDEVVLRDLAQEVGIGAETVTAAWSDPRYTQRLALNLQHARELGLRGTPTFVFGRQIIAGAVPEATLRQAAQRLAESDQTSSAT